jgi:hypothetical protein
MIAGLQFISVVFSGNYVQLLCRLHYCKTGGSLFCLAVPANTKVDKVERL